MLSKADIMRINLAAGLIAGALLGIGEILTIEIRTRVKAKALVTEVTEPAPATDGSGD